MPKLTIHDLFQAKKEGRQFVEIRTSDLNEAIACVEIEIVPARVTEEIGKRLEKLILISMGSGTGGTVQYLFATDVLGTNPGHIPRHAKVYGNIGAEEARVQRLRVEAFRALHDDVLSGGYPAQEHVLGIKDDEFERFCSRFP